MSSSSSADSSRINAAGTTFVIGLLIWLAATWTTVRTLVNDWLDPNSNYGHGLLVLGLCLFALWESRHLLARHLVQPQWLALPFVVLDSLLWAAAALAHVELVQYLALVAMLPLLVWACFGMGMVRQAMFPLGFIWTAIPVWDPLMPLFQSITALASTYMLQAIGVPVFREGNALSIPFGNFQIAEFCAGMRYMLAAVSLGAFFAWFYLSRLRDRLTFIGLVLVVAVVANWVRVTVVVVAGHLTHMQSSLVKDHAFMGWLLFACVMLPVFWYGGRLAKNTGTVVEPTAGRGAVVGDRGSRSISMPLVGAVLIGLICGPGLVYRFQADVPISNDTMQNLSGTTQPAVSGGWSPTVSRAPLWLPEFHGATHEGMFSYVRGGRRVTLYFAYYLRQTQGAELIYVRNRLYDESRWQLVGQTEISAAQTGATAVRGTVLRARDGSGMRYLWSWYDIGGKPMISKRKVKLMELWSLLMGHPGSALIALSTDVMEVDQAEAVLSDFLKNAGPGIRASLAELEVR